MTPLSPTKESLYKAAFNSYLAKDLSPPKLSAYLELASVERKQRDHEQNEVSAFLCSHLMTGEAGPSGSSAPYVWKHTQHSETTSKAPGQPEKATGSRCHESDLPWAIAQPPSDEDIDLTSMSIDQHSLGPDPQTTSSTGQEQETVTGPQRLFCQWCLEPFVSKVTFREHLRKICASNKVYRCSKCGVASRSRSAARFHRSRESSKCSGKVFEETTLSYDRQAYACRWDGTLYKSLKDFSRHAVNDCKGNPGISNTEPSLLIRALLQQDCFRKKANQLCAELGKPLESLWWPNNHCVNQFIDLLEFGECNIRDEINCGIAQEDVCEILRSFIQKASITPIEA